MRDSMPYPEVLLRAPLIGRLLGRRYVQVAIEGRWEVRRVYRLPKTGVDLIDLDRAAGVFDYYPDGGPWCYLKDFPHFWLTHSHTYR